MKKVFCLRLEDKLIGRLKTRSAELEKPASSVAREFIEEGLDHWENSRETRKFKRVPHDSEVES